MSHYVYRCYDAAGALLYVGASKNVPNRMVQHRLGTFWADQVVKVRVKVYPDKETACEAERRAIRDENPKYNVYGKRDRRGDWTSGDYDAHIRKLPSRRFTGSSRGQFERLFGEYLSRFGERHPLEAETRSRLDAADAKFEADMARRHALDEERRREFHQREAAEHRLHMEHCCSCPHGIIVDEDLIEAYGNEFKPADLLPRGGP